MKTLEQIKKCEAIEVDQASIYGGEGLITMEGWKGSVIWWRNKDKEYVSVAPFDFRINPSQEDMRRIKDIFFEEWELAVEVYPPKSKYSVPEGSIRSLSRPMNQDVLAYLGEKAP